MKIYLIDRFAKDDGNYFSTHDQSIAHVIVADSKKQVRQIAKAQSGDEDKKVWDNATISDLGIYTGRKKTPFLVVTDYHEA